MLAEGEVVAAGERDAIHVNVLFVEALLVSDKNNEAMPAGRAAWCVYLRFGCPVGDRVPSQNSYPGWPAHI